MFQDITEKHGGGGDGAGSAVQGKHSADIRVLNLRERAHAILITRMTRRDRYRSPFRNIILSYEIITAPLHVSLNKIRRSRANTRQPEAAALPLRAIFTRALSRDGQNNVISLISIHHIRHVGSDGE